MESSMTEQTKSGMDLDRLLSRNLQKRALIVDDEVESVNMMKMILIKAGIDVAGAFSGREAVEKCPQVRPHVILLDVMMPEMDGYQTFDHLRKITSAPVVIVSAKTQTDDIVKGLQIGADDYVTKPYRPAELVARVRTAMLRSENTHPIRSLVFPQIDLSINIESREATIRGETIFLPEKEFEILKVLAKHAPKAVRKEKIAEDVWGEDSDKAQKRIKYLVFLLRQKLEENPSDPQLIISHERFGYRLASES